ncbi:hypothetical protein V1283_008281 [Bradyrhizobium sp. AZCC 2262]|uniref:hypothetical protein n=1 Tax=Bradyrhizobium sp. AZCC 2262 TaxID=3117022 RepID=UPI002FF05FB7
MSAARYTPAMSESAEPLSVNGLVMPRDFPVASFEAVQRRIQPFAQTQNDLYIHFAGAWNAISYRYLSLVDDGETFTGSLKKHGSSPPAVERYNQERALFGFFSNGFSVFEAFFYGMFAIGALVKPTLFPLTTAADQQRVTPARTIDAYSRAFPGDAIVASMSGIYGDNAFKEYREIRNVLTHRSAPGRTFFLSIGSAEAPASQWKIRNIPLDESMASTRRAHVSMLLLRALDATRDFTDRTFS